MTVQSLRIPADANSPSVESSQSRMEKKTMPASLVGQAPGKYRIIEPLGRGGIAQVYRAYHPQLDCYVAVKVLRFNLLKHAEVRAALNNYFRMHAAVAKNFGVDFILESPTWRTSPDWGRKIGYSRSALVEINQQAIELLSEFGMTLKMKAPLW
jgi:serine/threonine protein kinase